MLIVFFKIKSKKKKTLLFLVFIKNTRIVFKRTKSTIEDVELHVVFIEFSRAFKSPLNILFPIGHGPQDKCVFDN